MLKLYKILEEVDSPINGRIQVVKVFGDIKLMVGGLPQSSRLVKKIWDAALKKLKRERFTPKDVLVLGVAGGSALELLSYYWPGAKITGVEIDPVMLRLGKKYFHLANIPNLDIIEADAQDFVEKTEEVFDMVLVDLYLGKSVPKQFMEGKFIKKLKGKTGRGGVVAFNHLYSLLEKEDASKLSNKLRKIFPVVKEVRPEANIIFLCFSK